MHYQFTPETARAYRDGWADARRYEHWPQLYGTSRLGLTDAESDAYHMGRADGRAFATHLLTVLGYSADAIEKAAVRGANADEPVVSLACGRCGANMALDPFHPCQGDA
jgi:hypothetical protein